MEKQPFVIDGYRDKQALEDGVLVSVPFDGKVNRVTRAVFDHFTRSMRSAPQTGEVTDLRRLQRGGSALMKERNSD